MAKGDKISMSVIRRLPRYYRFLADLHEKGIDHISSSELAERMGLTASQIRQDLNCFGGFGQQGYGYIVNQLRDKISDILGLDDCLKTILIGAGNLGKAVATHMSFESRGFELIGIFDCDPTLTGYELRNLYVQHSDDLAGFCKSARPQIAILCIPIDAAPDVTDLLYKNGIRHFWNFSHYDIARKHPDAVVENVHLSDSLMTLCYRAHHG